MDAKLENDLKTLEEIGIFSIEDMASAAADYIRKQKLTRTIYAQSALPDNEIDFLRRAGASGFGNRNADDFKDTIKESAIEYAKFIATSFHQNEVAEFLNISLDEVKKKSDGKLMYSFKTEKEISIYPKWQFTKNHSTIPGLKNLLSELSNDVHPFSLD